MVLGGHGAAARHQGDRRTKIDTLPPGLASRDKLTTEEAAAGDSVHESVPMSLKSTGKSSCMAALKKLVITLLVSGIYFGWALAFYCYYEGWRPLDALYFAMVTMSTVGYGDLYPRADDPVSELVTVAFLIFGVVVVFAEVSSCVAMMMHPFFGFIQARTDKCFPQKTIDLDGDGGSDFKIPNSPLVYYSKNLFAPIVVIIGGQFLWAYGYHVCEPALTYRRAW